MKKIVFVIVFILFANLIYAQQPKTKLDKAKLLIRRELKESMNDYSSYAPVSYSDIDSLFTSIWDDENFITTYVNPTIKYMDEVNKVFTNKISITYDAKPVLEKIKETSGNYNEDSVFNLEMFDNYQSLMYERIKLFKPEFIGWRLTHKFRAKNAYNATVLYDYEFKFDKDLSKVINYNSIKE